MIVQFKAKPKPAQILPDLAMRNVVDVPKTMGRQHVIEVGRLRPYVNSDMLGGMIRREMRKAGLAECIDVDNPPPGVSIEKGKLLATVTITLD